MAAGMVAFGAPVAGHVAPLLGQGYGTVLAFAAAQAVAAGVLIRAAVPGRWRGLGAVVAGVLLAGMGVGAAWSAAAGVLAGAGLAHAMLYAGLLAVFAGSLRGDAVVTRVARRVNPGFHPGMVPYTRAVTWVWCGLFAGQLGASAVLLGVAPGAWAGLVTGWHAVAVAVLAAAELGVRRWRWRHERPTGLAATVRGWRAVRQDAEGRAIRRDAKGRAIRRDAAGGG